jgi:hypothetical protein
MEGMVSPEVAQHKVKNSFQGTVQRKGIPITLKHEIIIFI